ncbi:protein lethal(2)essential for life-like [Ochlerotatus camptorhynchus]|uniref:protein lethal(2)essential for life-like n=1 Tax=Ochlerotatus camptorhynchus TaxID=644619 RepID=UPI0031E44F64
MALIPMLFGEWWDECMDNPLRSSRIISKPIDCDAFPGGFLLAIDNRPRRCERRRCRRHSGCDKDVGKEQLPAKKARADFQINVDVREFKPEEISVKAMDTYVIVEGKHEDKDVENGYALRHFVRRYQLPEGHDNEKIVSTLSSDGVLTISAPMKALALPTPKKERTIPVEHPKKSDQNGTKDEGSGLDFTLEDLDE